MCSDMCEYIVLVLRYQDLGSVHKCCKEKLRADILALDGPRTVMFDMLSVEHWCWAAMKMRLKGLLNLLFAFCYRHPYWQQCCGVLL